MATVHVVLATVQARALNGFTLPVPNAVPMDAETVTTSAASTQAGLEASSENPGVWSVTARDGDVWVKFGTDPTAAEGEGWLILTGQTREFSIHSNGEKIAIVDA